jgi:hypothetical protein
LRLTRPVGSVTGHIKEASPSASGLRGRGSHQPSRQRAENSDSQCSKIFATRSTHVWNGPISAKRLRTTSLTSGSANQLIDLEKQWQDLARSYEFIETLEQFLFASRALPSEVDKLPKDFPPE